MAEPENAPQIEVDTAQDDTDNDSSIDERLSSYTASLSSSVVDYPIEHGRRYHAFRGGNYVLPNDEKEMDRLDLTHTLMVKVLGDRLYLAPIEPTKMSRVLDIGTGTGIWAMEMGDLFPGVEVLGNDLSPIQPAWVPPNVKFEVDDVEDEWLHDTPFDYILCRYMAGCILDWPKLVKNIYDHTKPGGWAEFQDFDFVYYSDDGTLTEEHHTLKWIQTLIEAGDKIGRLISPGPEQHAWVKDAGFENIKHQMYKVPIGPWAKDPRMKDIGMCNLAQILDGLEAFSLRLFCGVLKWTEEEVHVLLAKVRQELKSGKVHALFNFYVVYGQKPGKDVKSDDEE